MGYTVTVDVYLDHFDDDDLIEEIESRGYEIVSQDALSAEEIQVILDLVARAKPGTIEYDIYEKLRKR